jgi:hypothetical protein
MRKLIPIAALAALAVMIAFTGCSATSASNEGGQYEVMNPWADVDPFPPKGISLRLDSPDGKKIGLFANSKRSAVPQARMIEKKLKEKFPTIQTDLYHAPEPTSIAKDGPDWGKFTAWIKTVDAVILTVGD